MKDARGLNNKINPKQTAPFFDKSAVFFLSETKLELRIQFVFWWFKN
jgi:hypothetical protein